MAPCPGPVAMHGMYVGASITILHSHHSPRSTLVSLEMPLAMATTQYSWYHSQWSQSMLTFKLPRHCPRFPEQPLGASSVFSVWRCGLHLVTDAPPRAFRHRHQTTVCPPLPFSGCICPSLSPLNRSSTICSGSASSRPTHNAPLHCYSWWIKPAPDPQNSSVRQGIGTPTIDEYNLELRFSRT